MKYLMKWSKMNYFNKWDKEQLTSMCKFALYQNLVSFTTKNYQFFKLMMIPLQTDEPDVWMSNYKFW